MTVMLTPKKGVQPSTSKYFEPDYGLGAEARTEAANLIAEKVHCTVSCKRHSFDDDIISVVIQSIGEWQRQSKVSGFHAIFPDLSQGSTGIYGL